MIIRKKYVDKILQYLGLVSSVFLVGSRQVGKTTILKSLLEYGFIDKKKSFYVNFDDFVLGGNTSFDSVFSFLDFLEFTYNISFENLDYLIFDEVKNIKNFNILLKSLIDKYPNKKFICTSSGNYIWTNEIIEGLAGRTLQIDVYPLDFQEFLLFKGKQTPRNFDENVFSVMKKYLDEYMTFGGYPALVLASYNNKKLILKSIIDSVILKDIKGFLKDEKIMSLPNILIYMGTNVGSKFSYENIAQFTGEKIYTIKQQLRVLEQSYLIKKITPFFTNKRKELSSKGKYYILDFGLMNYFLNNFQSKKLIVGKDIEMFVYLNLLYNLQENDKLNFWQTLNESEIDFILQRNGKIIPIEVKSGNKDNIPKIFKIFCEKYNKQIDYFIKTTQYLQKNRKIDNCLIHFVPYGLIK